jgi:hypothetical protein
VPGAGRRDLAAEAAHRRRVDHREAQAHGPHEVAQFAPGQRRGEQDEDVAAATRRDVPEHLAAKAAQKFTDRAGLRGYEFGSATFMVVPDSRTISCAASAGHVKVED